MAECYVCLLSNHFRLKINQLECVIVIKSRVLSKNLGGDLKFVTKVRE